MVVTALTQCDMAWTSGDLEELLTAKTATGTANLQALDESDGAGVRQGHRIEIRE